MRLRVERRDRHAVLTLSRPERLNALDGELLRELDSALVELDLDPAVRAIVLTGEGRGFCAGLDLDRATTLDDLPTPTLFHQQRAVSESLTRPFLTAQQARKGLAAES